MRTTKKQQKQETALYPANLLMGMLITHLIAGLVQWIEIAYSGVARPLLADLLTHGRATQDYHNSLITYLQWCMFPTSWWDIFVIPRLVFGGLWGYLTARGTISLNAVAVLWLFVSCLSVHLYPILYSAYIKHLTALQLIAIGTNAVGCLIGGFIIVRYSLSWTKKLLVGGR